MATLADSSGIAYVSTHAVFISPQIRSYAYGKHGVTVEVIESAQCQSFSAIISTYSGRQLEAGISFIIGQRMETTHGHGQGTDSIYFLGYIMNLVVQTGNISLTGSSLIADGLLVSCNGSIMCCIFIGTGFSFCIDVLLQSCIGILTGTNFLRDICSIGCNISFITSNASFMIVQSVAIGFDCILVVLNIASICLDVCVILANLSILCVLLTLDGCKTVSHFRIQLAICIFTFRSFLLVSIYASVGFLLDGFSITFNVTFIGSNAVFMVGKFIAIDFDSIFVFLNIASICLDVCVILANLSILCVLLTLDGCKTVSHFRIQLAICIFTFSSFIGIGLIQSCESSRHILVDVVESIHHILVDLFDNFILCFIGTNTGCNFLMKSRIYIGEILTDRLIFLNQIAFRCDILVIRNQINPVFQSLRNFIGIVSSFVGGLCGIGRSKNLGIFQSILNICNILLALGNISGIGMNFSICLIYPTIGFGKMFLQILSRLSISNDSLRVILNGCSQLIINTCLCTYSFIEVVLQILICLIPQLCLIIDIGLQILICSITGFSFCIDITLQLLVCCIAGLSFNKIVFIQLICNLTDILIEIIETFGYILIYLLNDLILRSISTNAGCCFFGQGAIQISYIFANGLISFSNSTILYRCIGLADVIGCCLFFQIVFYAGNPFIQIRVSFRPSCRFIGNSFRVSIYATL